MLTETAPPAITAAMQDELARHLRLSTGFGDDQSVDAAAALRAAIAHLEGVLGLCLAPRAFVWRGRLGEDRAVSAPIAPVRSLISVSRVLNNGVTEPVSLSFFSLDEGATRTRLRSTASISHQLEFAFEAGFGADWSATPVDLRRAALMVATEHFDKRHASTSGREYASMHGVAALIQPWRPLRLGAGAWI